MGQSVNYFVRSRLRGSIYIQVGQMIVNEKMYRKELRMLSQRAATARNVAAKAKSLIAGLITDDRSSRWSHRSEMSLYMSHGVLRFAVEHSTL